MKANKRLVENAAKLSYKLINDLLYFDNNEKDLRLYILSAIKVEIFKLTHNEIDHLGYARTHERLT